MAYKNVSASSYENLLKKAATLYLEEETSSVIELPFNPSEKFIIKMKKLFEEEKKWNSNVNLKILMKRAAMYIFIILGVLSSILIFNEDVRAGLKNMLIEIFDDHVQIQFEKEELPEDFIEFDLDRIPKEYRIENYENFHGFISMELYTIDDKLIRLSLSPIDSSGTKGIDNEHHEIKQIIINDVKVIIVEPKIDVGVNILLWNNQGYRYDLNSSEIEIKELIKLSEKIIKK